MPIYALQCLSCGSEQDVFRSVAEMNRDLPDCCGETMSRKIVAPMVAADIAPYQSMATGEWISSRSAHKEHLKKHRLVEVGNETLKPKTITPPKQEERKKMIAEIAYAKKYA